MSIFMRPRLASSILIGSTRFLARFSSGKSPLLPNQSWVTQPLVDINSNPKSLVVQKISLSCKNKKETAQKRKVSIWTHTAKPLFVWNPHWKHWKRSRNRIRMVIKKVVDLVSCLAFGNLVARLASLFMLQTLRELVGGEVGWFALKATVVRGNGRFASNRHFELVCSTQRHGKCGPAQHVALSHSTLNTLSSILSLLISEFKWIQAGGLLPVYVANRVGHFWENSKEIFQLKTKVSGIDREARSMNLHDHLPRSSKGQSDLPGGYTL